jgi:hypothetical protein
MRSVIKERRFYNRVHRGREIVCVNLPDGMQLPFLFQRPPTVEVQPEMKCAAIGYN